MTSATQHIADSLLAALKTARTDHADAWKRLVVVSIANEIGVVYHSAVHGMEIAVPLRRELKINIKPDGGVQRDWSASGRGHSYSDPAGSVQVWDSGGAHEGGRGHPSRQCVHPRAYAHVAVGPP